jgi:putative inorganic carbon (HCO3(-)) transporter
VVNVLYPVFLAPPSEDLAHAHNIFLQVAVDLGLGGLIAYGALLLLGAAAAWDVARASIGSSRYLAVGLLASLLGLHVYGLADAIALGSKPGLAFWMLLGLIAALAAGVPERRLAERPVDGAGARHSVPES